MNKNKTRCDLNFYQQAVQDILDRSNYGFIGKQVLRSIMTSTITSPANDIPFRVRPINKLNEYYMEIDEDDWNNINKIYGNRASFASIDEVPIYDPLKPECHRLFFYKNFQIPEAEKIKVPSTVPDKYTINYTNERLYYRKMHVKVHI